ncbi:MAG: hypothetical protein ACREDR_28020 [Blastocatellia bacterium]
MSKLKYLVAQVEYSTTDDQEEKLQVFLDKQAGDKWELISVTHRILEAASADQYTMFFKQPE